MLSIKPLLTARSLNLLVAAVLIVAYPLSAVAIAEADETGPTSPTGADSSSYTYNASTGLWENDYYTWNPQTKQTSPKTPKSYSYNPTTGMWDTTEWVWDAPSNKYVPNTQTSASNPTAASTPSANANYPAASASSVTNAGPDSNNAISQTQNNNGTFDLFYNAAISNDSTATAKTGNATVAGNTLAGSSTSGSASSIANILNLLQSNWDPQAALPLLFSADINGDVTGDLILDPNSINTTGPGSSATIDSQHNNNLTINYEANGAITNNITLDAISGDSTVNGNTEAGNAVTGDARVVANIINMLNSAINAGKSFIGNLNINGNFNGDILLPPNFLDQLIAHSGPNSTVDLSHVVNNDVVAKLENTQTINNNTSFNAATGSADVTGNTAGGSATTGNAETKLNVLNLTGKQVIDANTLLVFVNVLGQWVGMLVNAPSSSNSAAFCGGDCQISSLIDNNVDINAKSNFTITNNLDLDALSGNALVSNNTKGGNARSGNSSASANILNILGSDLKTTDWLGILFINVNGFWNGSFGINTAAGSLSSTTAGGLGGGSTPAIAKVFQFVPNNDDDKFVLAPFFGGTSSGNASASSQAQTAAAASTQSSDQSSIAAKPAINNQGGIPGWLLPVIGAAVALAVFSLGAATELYDKLWAARVTRISNRKAGTKNFSLSIKKWLRGLSWKLPLF